MMTSPTGKQSDFNPLEELQSEVLKNIRRIFSLSDGVIENISFRPPPAYVHADYALPTFLISEIVGENPVSVAKKLAQEFHIESDFLKKVSALGPYLNIEVHKELYNHAAIGHIARPAKKHTVSAEAFSKVLIHYFVPTEITALDELRLLLIGKAIGNSYTFVGRNTQHYYCAGLPQVENTSVISNLIVTNQPTAEELLSFADTVINTALRMNVAESIGLTNAVITVAGSQHAQVVLRRQDGSPTDFIRYLAYIESLHISEPATVIFICPKEHTAILDNVLALSKYLGLINPDTKISLSSIPTGGRALVAFSPADTALLFATLRIPFFERLSLNANSSNSFHELELQLNMLKLSIADEELGSEEKFKIVHTLLEFGKVPHQITTNHDPSILCTYLEQVTEFSKKLQVVHDKSLAIAVTSILQQGLTLLLA